MKLRSGVYIVPTDKWYIERTVWLIAGIVLLASTAMALLVNKLFMFGVIATGLVSINVAFTGFCPVGSALRMLGFSPMLGEEKSKHKYLYFMQTDKWYLERRIYLAVGINISVASVVVLTYSAWATLFTLFVGGAMNLLWIAALTGLVSLEKLAPKGELVARALGGVMIGAGVAKWAWTSLP